ncbi:MAG: hypothetical protein ACRYGM_19735 [Janthinobacterium lividum]
MTTPEAFDAAQRWQLIAAQVKNGADRLQATTDVLPPEFNMVDAAVIQALLSRHAQALVDHMVAVNCLAGLLAECVIIDK